MFGTNDARSVLWFACIQMYGHQLTFPSIHLLRAWMKRVMNLTTGTMMDGWMVEIAAASVIAVAKTSAFKKITANATLLAALLSQ